jgi:hypothetical protein
VKILLVLASLIAAFTIAFTLRGTLDYDENEYFYLVIDYYSSWNATVTNNDEIFLKGMGNKKHLFVWPQESEANVTVTAYKLDNSDAPLTIRMKKIDGTSLGQASTSTPNGFVTLTIKLN